MHNARGTLHRLKDAFCRPGCRGVEKATQTEKIKTEDNKRLYTVTRANNIYISPKPAACPDRDTAASPPHKWLLFGNLEITVLVESC